MKTRSARLTPKQRQVYQYVRSYTIEHGYAPSLMEIRDHLGLSAVSTVHEHLADMSRKGVLRRGWNRARSIEPLASRDAREVPLAGAVAAGSPIEAIETPGSVAIPPDLAGRGESFALRVKGESMTGDGILDGDLIVVEKRRRVENGSLAVVLLRGGRRR